MKKDKVVQIYDDVPRAGTFLIAKGFDRKHASVAILIERFRGDFEEFGPLVTRKVKTKGRPVIEFWLNEDQAMLLGTYMRNSVIVREFKKKLIKEFRSLKNQLGNLGKHQKASKYLPTREAGKVVRKQTTDAMKEFVAYAEAQGSTKADMYYTCITRMLNGLLFIVEGKYKNLRNVMTITQLMTVSSAEQIIDKGLMDGMKARMFYKDIYKDIRTRVETFAELHGQSKVLSEQLRLDQPDLKELEN